MESVIFKESPIAEYLEGTGHAADVTWEVEPTAHSESDGDNETTSPLSFAPSPSRPRLYAKKLKQVLQQQQRMGPKSGILGMQLYEVFSRAIDSRLSRSENSRFLERFRYIIVASQLLNVHVNASRYSHQRVGDTSASVDQDSQTTGEDGSVPPFGPRFAKLRYWAGNGFCGLALAIVLGWLFRWGANRQGDISTWRTVAAMLMCLVVGIISFAHHRRGWLRLLRGRTIELASQFVASSQIYDILASNTVTFIQEVELVSRGYRLSAPLPPITRLERDSQTRRCSRLRRALLSQLVEAIAPYSLASTALRGMIQESDLDKYFDIYEIGKEDLEDAELGLKDLDPEDTGSLKTLKTLFHRLHTTRRIFMCYLLTLDATGGYSDFFTWRLVTQQLQSLGHIMQNLGNGLREISEEEERFNIPSTPQANNMSSTNERWRGQLRKLDSLSQALRGLQAKMQVLREESNRTVQESIDVTEFGPHLLAHYDSIGADLKVLVDEWESGRVLLALNIDKQDQRLSLGSVDLDTSGKLHKVGKRISGSTGMITQTVSAAEADNASQGEEDLEEAHEVIIFEAVSDPRPQRESMSKLTREERIKKVQEERIKLMEERKKREAGKTLVKELQTVLINRPQGKRLSVRMT